MFSVHTKPEKFENATITGHAGFVFEVNLDSDDEIIVFEKLRFKKCFPSTLKLTIGVFKCLRFEERFRKVPFS